MRFESPYALALFLVVLLLLYLRSGKHMSAGLKFPTVSNAKRVNKTLKLRLKDLPQFLRVIVLSFLCIAIARPQEGRERVRDVTSGIAIEMVVDRSSSMGAEIEYGGRHMSRLEAVKKTFVHFVQGGRGVLEGRPNDLIGMVTFARYADTVCPLTLAHGALSNFIDTVKLVTVRSEDGTAIGDALALAAARLKTAEDTLAGQLETGAKKNYDIKSKVIILLTDGQSNFGKRGPLEAAELAGKWGIKIYCIGVGSGDAVTTIQTAFGEYKMPTSSSLDESTLTKIAEETGGVYRRADTADALVEIYKEINELEKTKIETVRYLDFRELFSPFALLSLFLLTVEIMLGCTFLRRLP